MTKRGFLRFEKRGLTLIYEKERKKALRRSFELLETLEDRLFLKAMISS